MFETSGKRNAIENTTKNVIKTEQNMQLITQQKPQLET